MKPEMYSFDGKLYNRNDLIKLNFCVEKHCIQSFIEQLQISKLNENGCGYLIGNEQNYLISNCLRSGKRITLQYSAYFMCEKLKVLGFRDDSEIRNSIEVYRYEFDKSRRGKCKFNVLIWSKSKGYYMQKRNGKQPSRSIYSPSGKHIVELNTYSC